MTIREGARKDLPIVLKFVQKLADYQKEPDAVKAGRENYINNYDEGMFEMLIAEEEGEAVGLALYYFTWSTWKGKVLYLEDFIVDVSKRGSGVGSALWEKLLKTAKKNECVMMKWEVVNWNTPAIDFYKAKGADFSEEWINCSVEV